MLKRAYELGVEMAREEAGITKEAFAGLGSKLVSQGAKFLGGGSRGAKMLGFAAKNPLAAKTIAGAGVGGLGGAAFGDEGGMLRGAMMGAGVGAGAHFGSRLGLGRAGRLGQNTLLKGMTGKMSPRAMQYATQRGSFDAALKAMQASRGKAMAGLGAGALGGGMLASGVAGGMVPGRR
jgi:hypothetical protein